MTSAPIHTAPLPDAIQWSEGMMLSPQHLQQNDRYWHAHLRHRLQAVAPHYWGVLKLHVDIVKEVLILSELSRGSSYGAREQGFAAVEFYTQMKTVYVGD